MKRSLRIVRVMPFFHLRRGGSVAQALATCSELAARGHDVRVVTSDLDQPAEVARNAWSTRDGFRVWYGKVGLLGRAPPYWQPQLRDPIAACMADADVLCLHVGLTATNSLARRLAVRHAVPYVYNAEGALCPTRLRDKALRKRVFLALFERRTLRDADAIQAVTQKEANDALALGADVSCVHVIPNGVALPTTRTTRETARARLGWPTDEFVILFLGRLSEMKCPDVLLEAAASLLGPGRARLVLAGPDDGMAQLLRARAAQIGVLDRVHLPGLVVGDERENLWSAADVFVLPSRSEGLPLGPLEAAARGLPAIVTRACNLPEIAIEDAGAVVDEGVGPLRAALAEIAGDVNSLRRRSENARSMVGRHFAIGTVVDRLENLYAQLAGRS